VLIGGEDTTRAEGDGERIHLRDAEEEGQDRERRKGKERQAGRCAVLFLLS